ncbi:pimeloyl-ACP methyl ester carboxylesterase [Nocardia sp. GAS34]|uniref:alpha/beta fold hydrolase n=1 Tax=unclassified Nocardia TaxID=2637762 RepID=UPI003D1E1582
MRLTLFSKRACLLVAALTAATSLTTSCSESAPSTSTVSAAAEPLPGFHDGTIDHDGIAVHYISGGHGPAIVLLHGWPENWRAWSKIAPSLARDHTVYAIDLRGYGDSGLAKSDEGYQALAVTTDIHALAQQLNLGRFDLVGHDWGGAIALAYATQYRSDIAHLAVLEAPPSSDYLHLVQTKPDVFWWDWLAKGPKGELPEDLIAGKEALFYGHFYDEADGAIDSSERNQLIAALSKPGRTHAALEYFRQQDVGERQVDDLIARDGKLTIPVLGVGGEHSLGSAIGNLLNRVADHVTTDVVPGANHWVLEENPDYVSGSLRTFLTS